MTDSIPVKDYLYFARWNAEVFKETTKCKPPKRPVESPTGQLELI